MSAFSVAQLAIYSVLVCPALYLTLCHRRNGVLGWGYLMVFCILRITGGALSIHSSGSGAKIISSVGISPMLLALDGILHEARVYRSRNLNKRLEYTFMAFVHVVVATGVAMVGTGASSLAGKNPEASDQTNLDVGMALLEACWATLTVWALWTLKDCTPPRRALSDGFYRYPGYVRTDRGINPKRNLNPVNGSLAIRTVLGLLPELITTLILMFVGFRTRHIGGISYNRRMVQQDET
ncbi:integral membrane protein [Aspergillus fumigatus]|nr:integral membrane protein [Aspergillus fumigatus]